MVEGVEVVVGEREVGEKGVVIRVKRGWKGCGGGCCCGCGCGGGGGVDKGGSGFSSRCVGAGGGRGGELVRGGDCSCSCSCDGCGPKAREGGAATVGGIADALSGSSGFNGA